MKFSETKLAGAFLIERDPITDDRGSFERVFCQKKFNDHGLSSKFIQANLCRNNSVGILRGMHFQTGSFSETRS